MGFGFDHWIANDDLALFHEFDWHHKRYVAYFQISYIAVDWFTIIQFPGSVLGNILVALLLQTRKFGFRRLCLFTGTFTVVSNLLILTATIFPMAYPLIYAGEFLFGVCHSNLIISFIQLANHRFSKNQIGLAISVLPLTISLGLVLDFLITSDVFIPPTDKMPENTSSISDSESFKLQS